MKKWWSILIIVVAFVSQMLVVMPSGSRYCSEGACGTYFWGAHEHDGVWHMALAEAALSSYPPIMPNYSGEVLRGYNALLDYVIYGVNALTTIPVAIIYFKLIPLLWFGMMIYAWGKFAKANSSNKHYFGWLILFLFFGNSLSYLLRFFHEGHINGGSGLLSMQSPQMLTNIQFALSLPLLALALTLFKNKAGTYLDGVKLAILNFLMMALKFYGGVILLIMSLIYSMLQYKAWGVKKVITQIAIISFAFGLSTWIFYNPFAATQQEQILQFSPMTTVRPIIEEIALVYLPQVAAARNNLLAQGIGIKLVAIELFTLVVFILLNFGTRLVGIASWIRQIKKDNFHLVTLSGALAGLLLNILFVQRGEWWNTVQFLYYTMIIMSIYSAEWIATWSVKKGNARIIMAVTIVALTIPNAIDTVKIFAHFPPGSYISDDETIVLKKLKGMEMGTVLALPLQATRKSNLSPAPLYDRYETSYVSALTGMPTYLNDLVQLRLTGINYQQRLDLINSSDCKVLEEVKYVYTPSPELLIGWDRCNSKIEKILQMGEASVYQVIR